MGTANLSSVCHRLPWLLLGLVERSSVQAQVLLHPSAIRPLSTITINNQLKWDTYTVVNVLLQADADALESVAEFLAALTGRCWNVASYIYIHVTFVSCSVLFTCIVITVAHFVVKLCCLLLDHVWILVMVSRFDMHSRLDMAMAACIMSVSPTDRFNQSVRLVSLPPPPFTFSSRVCLSLSYKYSFCNAHFQSDLYGYTGLDKMFVTVIHESD